MGSRIGPEARDSNTQIPGLGYTDYTFSFGRGFFCTCTDHWSKHLVTCCCVINTRKRNILSVSLPNLQVTWHSPLIELCLLMFAWWESDRRFLRIWLFVAFDVMSLWNPHGITILFYFFNPGVNFFFINVGVQVNLYAPRLIPQILKLTIM